MNTDNYYMDLSQQGGALSTVIDYSMMAVPAAAGVGAGVGASFLIERFAGEWLPEQGSKMRVLTDVIAGAVVGTGIAMGLNAAGVDSSAQVGAGFAIGMSAPATVQYVREMRANAGAIAEGADGADDEVTVAVTLDDGTSVY
jgi:hypothetical protein